MSGALLRILSLDFFERPVRYRLPFRFGAATVTEGMQAFVRARIALPDGREAEGASAELMVPKWFDKDPALSIADNVEQLRCALCIARDAYLADAAPRTAFGHYAAHIGECLEAGGRLGLPALVAGFGPAEIDKAVLDALCRALGLPFAEAVRRNAIGFAPASVAPDVAGMDAGAFVNSLTPRTALAVRHTIGMADDLPQSVELAIAGSGVRWFKVKLGGDVAEDVRRLRAIACVLDTLPGYGVTLDGNEQFAADSLPELVQALRIDGGLRRLADAIAFIEQPLPRAATFDVDAVPGFPMLIDEADGTLDAFPRARARGYTGVSSKSCKGLYKSLVNAMRCAAWGEPYFLSAEDLTTPAGLALDQDVALASMLGVAHIERNGFHYLQGPDASLDIRDGQIRAPSLRSIGFASDAAPDWRALTPMRTCNPTETTE
jgi:hypothetical protein